MTMFNVNNDDTKPSNDKELPSNDAKPIDGGYMKELAEVLRGEVEGAPASNLNSDRTSSSLEDRRFETNSTSPCTNKQKALPVKVDSLYIFSSNYKTHPSEHNRLLDS